MICLVLIVSTMWADALGMGGAREVQRLHNMLFSDYEKTARPRLDYSEPTTVSAQLTVSYVYHLDTKHQLLRLKALMRLSWKDDLLQWNPANHSNLEEIIVPQNLVWRPDMTIINTAQERDYIGSDDVLVLIKSNGLMAWEPGFFLESSCQVDVSRYPFDVNVCLIQLTAWMSNNRSVQLEFAEVPVDLRFMMKNGEFEIVAGNQRKYYNQFENDTFYDVLEFSLKFTRRPAYFVLSVVIPIILLELLSIMSFVMSPEEPEKVTVSITALLSFTVLLSVIDSSMPRTSDKISLLLIYVTSLLGLSFLNVVGNIFVITINRWEETKDSDKDNSFFLCICSRRISNSNRQSSPVTGDTTRKRCHMYGIKHRKISDSLLDDQSKPGQSEDLVHGNLGDVHSDTQWEARITNHSDGVTRKRMSRKLAHRLNTGFLILSCVAFLLISGIIWLLMFA